MAGSHLPDSVHLLTYKINKVLGNQTTCLTYLETENSFDDLASMCDALNKDDIDTVIFLSGNPVYHVPSIDWSDLLKNTKSTFRLGDAIDETSQLCDYHIGQSHFLECWDMGVSWHEDNCSPVQPLLAPLFDTCSDLEVLSSLLKENKNSHDIVLDFFDNFSEISVNFEDFLKLGTAVLKPSLIKDLPDADSALLEIKPKEFSLSDNSLEVLLTPDFHTWDGQFSNNGWMMECPSANHKTLLGITHF